jgi:hypothetical protein
LLPGRTHKNINPALCNALIPKQGVEVSRVFCSCGKELLERVAARRRKDAWKPMQHGHGAAFDPKELPALPAGRAWRSSAASPVGGWRGAYEFQAEVPALPASVNSGWG